MPRFLLSFKNLDWLLFATLIPLLTMGVLTMKSFLGTEVFFSHQLIWIALSLVVFFVLSTLDFRFLRRTGAVVAIYSASALLLIVLLLVGKTVKGATSWFSLGGFSFQPSDLAKLALIIVLAKYFFQASC